jgi:acetyl/propionyl-CoA carboxylase alpha subunit
MKYRYQSGDITYEVVLERHGDGYRVMINGEAYDLEVLDDQPGVFTLRFSGQDGPFRPAAVYWGAEGDVKWLSSQGCTYKLERPTDWGARRPRGAAGGTPQDNLRAPMPAQVRAVQVSEGDSVEAGQTVLLLEAMKMEIRLQSPRQARIARLLTKPGDQVERDQVLVELE